jgi:hypothetical protein
MKYQRGLALTGLIFWGIVIVLVAVLSMKVVPTVIEYFKISKDCKAVIGQMGPEATVTDVKVAFDKYADIDQLGFKSSQLDISKENGKIVLAFDYEKRIPLFANVSLVLAYKGSTAE